MNKQRLSTGIRTGNILLAGLLAASLAFLGACSSSSSPSSTDDSANRSFGEIESLGSIVVNGVRYETEGGTIIGLDNHPGLDDLLPGMVVEVDVTGTGTVVKFDDNVKGPLTEVTGDDNVKVTQIMGQTVIFEDNVTKFDPATGMPLGDDVNKVFLVSGFQDDNGKIQATFASRVSDDFQNFLAGGGVLEVTGTVSDLGATTFMIAGLTVNYSNAALRDLPGGALVNGLLVEVKGSAFDPTTNTLTATEIEGKERGLGGDDSPKVHVEGLIADLTATTFTLNGQTVNYANASFRAGEGADLANGIKVEAEGPLVNGVIVATRVTFKASVRVEAAIASVDPATGTLTFLGLPGITVLVHPELTRDDDNVFAALQVGNDVKVRARQGASDLVATRLELVGESADRTIIRGPVTAVAGNMVTILGTVQVDTTGISNDNFKDHDTVIGRTAFFAALQAGDIAKARFRDGNWDEIEFQD